MLAELKTEWNTCRVRTGNVGRSQWVRGQRWGHLLEPPGRCITGNMLAVVLAGCGRMRCRQGWVPLRPGACVWMRPGHPYMAEQDPDAPVSHYFLGFDLADSRGTRLPRRTALPPEFIEPPDPEFVEAAARRIVELCYGFTPMGVAVAPYPPRIAGVVDALLTGLLMDLDAAADHQTCADAPLPPPPHYVRLVREAILQIEADPCAMPSVAELARHSRYSVGRFSRLFKLVAGLSPESFMVRARLHRAERLLRETSLPVAEVATAAGYRDSYFFSHQFKKFHGVSPLRYRREHI
ncbi:MAG: AraC family transcriptional regulator [Kiritimatiellae bacterium]|nr:AraC family transcriptional regulator [Kiritimatiellia bacterium]